MSRQGFYRLPLRTIDAVKDGELSLFDWSLYTWLAANADYETGLVRTCAPNLAVETGASVITIRKTLRRLRENEWIFYTTVKHGIYPIGIYDHLLPDSKRTPTADEWRLQYGKSVRLIQDGPSEINLWINLWINLISSIPGGQLFLRESQGQSRGQSPRPSQPPRTTGAIPHPVQAGGQSTGQSADQSIPTAPLQNTNERSEQSRKPTHTTSVRDSTGKLGGDTSSGTNNLDGKIWQLYEMKYKERTRGKFKPGHSRDKATKSIEGIRYMLDPLRKPGSTDENYLKLLGDALDIYFKQRDNFVSSVKWNLATFVSRLPGILEEIEARIA